MFRLTGTRLRSGSTMSINLTSLEDRKRWDEDDVGKRTFTPTCALVKLFRVRNDGVTSRSICTLVRLRIPKRGMIRVDFKNGGFLQIVRW